MRTIVEADIYPDCSSSGAKKQSEFMTTTPHRSRSNSNNSEQESLLNDYIFIPSSPSSASLLIPSNTR